MICFQETTNTGFGDRLRGVAYLLHLATLHGQRELLYNDDVAVRTPEFRDRCFPARMTDLVRIEGLSFEYHPLPLPSAEHHVTYDSLKVREDHERPGFKAMRRLRPRDDAVAERVAALGVDRSYIGLHARETDNIHNQSQHFEDQDALVQRTVENVRKVTGWRGQRKIFLAADNADSLRKWTGVFTDEGYTILTNAADYDSSSLRQTSLFDMLVDFFALAACRRVVRLAPSEFSRFAAWVGGHHMKCHHLV